MLIQHVFISFSSQWVNDGRIVKLKKRIVRKYGILIDKDVA